MLRLNLRGTIVSFTFEGKSASVGRRPIVRLGIWWSVAADGMLAHRRLHSLPHESVSTAIGSAQLDRGRWRY